MMLNDCRRLTFQGLLYLICLSTIYIFVAYFVLIEMSRRCSFYLGRKQSGIGKGGYDCKWSCVPKCEESHENGGPFTPEMSNVSMATIQVIYSDVQHGGHWKPTSCSANYHVAIIVPYRDRDTHLLVFLRNLHGFLKYQLLDYRIFIVEQTSDALFNRAALMNVGFLEAEKLEHFKSFVFHDVDSIPADTRNLYACPNSVRHLAVARDKNRFRLPYKGYVGGVLCMSVHHIRQINGFVNFYFGWGGEDDDIRYRLQREKVNITRPPRVIGKYRSVPHKGDPGNPRSRRTMRGVSNNTKFYKYTGLNDQKYELRSTDLYPLYTRILVKLDGPQNRSEIRTYMEEAIQKVKEEHKNELMREVSSPKPKVIKEKLDSYQNSTKTSKKHEARNKLQRQNDSYKNSTKNYKRHEVR